MRSKKRTQRMQRLVARRARKRRERSRGWGVAERGIRCGQCGAPNDILAVECRRCSAPLVDYQSQQWAAEAGEAEASARRDAVTRRRRGLAAGAMLAIVL